jgi:hypothetical protein
MLIGELLGPAQVGINQHTERALTSCQGLNESDRRRFRTLAENRQQVEALLDRGVVKRKALLDAILENARLDTPDEAVPVGVLRDTYRTLVIDPPGMSTREISGVLGVGKDTVARDQRGANATPELQDVAEDDTVDSPPVADATPDPDPEPEPESPDLGWGGFPSVRRARRLVFFVRGHLGLG